MLNRETKNTEKIKEGSERDEGGSKRDKGRFERGRGVNEIATETGVNGTDVEVTE